ncbi:MAG: cytosine permease [Alphaproteobacteria bacterium]|nr:MAG: cytosine permease [Alphaproteobacteria bacterium]
MSDLGDLEELTKDYSLEPVPDDHAVSGIRIALIVIGFAITLPVLLAGSRIGLAMGLERAVQSFLIGGGVLAFVGCITAYIGARTRLSTYMITQFSFGTGGARVINLLIAITLFGWYGVTAYLFGKACQGAIFDIYGVSWPETPFTVLGSLLMVLTTVWGFKALDKLALVAVPLMVAFLIAVVWYSLQAASWEAILGRAGGDMTEGVATSLVVGSYIVGAILLPDLCRYARYARDGVIAAFISLGIAFPGIFLVATIPSLATGQNDLVVIMMGLGLGVPALAMIIFATWTSNANNLYSTSLTLATVLPRIAKWKITIAAGLMGTVLAALGVMDYFVDFLLFLGICIPPIAGIYIADFFFLRRRCYDVAALQRERGVNRTAFAVWLFASAVGYASAHGVIQGTSIPACDSMIVAFLLYLGWKKIGMRVRSGRVVGA